LRGGGSAAIIGIGGGRDALAAWLNGFTRIVGVEINGAIVDLDLRRLNWWSGPATVPGLVIYRGDGRSFLTRSHEKFDGHPSLHDRHSAWDCRGR
jgi:spermidine synthase